MDFPSFRAALEASRSFEASSAGATFTLRRPTDHAWRVSLETHRDPGGRVLESVAMRELLNTALVGWQGLTQRHLLAEAGEEPIAFSPDARTLLLETRQDIADDLAVELAVRIAKKREEREATAKN